jgi:hypothetical protein
MMRHATWSQLNEHVLVRVIAKAYQLLGLRLTQKKLAQTIPFVGVGLNAALSAQLTEQTFRRAGAVYRLRFLSEKYGIDPASWLRESHDSSAIAGPEDIVDVDELLQHEIIEALEDDAGAEAEDDGSEPGNHPARPEPRRRSLPGFQPARDEFPRVPPLETTGAGKSTG